MKNISSWLLAAVLFVQLPVVAQPVTPSMSQLNFGAVNELTPDSLQLTLTNPHSFAVSVTGISFFNTYRTPAFSVQQPVFTLPANGSHSLWVKFAPQHNIAHNTEMVIHTDSKLGSISIDLQGQGVYSNTYYSTTQNMEEQALKVALKDRITLGYNSLGYNTARDRMFMIIDNKKVNGQGAPVNTLECVYTGRLAVGYTSRSDAQTNHNFNTEHTYPQSYFNQAEPMKSDLHHLFPTDAAANNSRANYPFGIPTQPYQQVAINAPSILGANLRYEPRNEHKGAAARAMLYFVIRYQDYSNYISGQQAVLKGWNQDFAPTAADILRNSTIALPSNQNNRNPFVDYPQFADRITNFSGTSVAPQVEQLFASDSVINFGQPVLTQPIYRYVLVNSGNVPVGLSNFALSNTTNLSFASTPVATTLQPGEAISLDVQLNNLPASDSLVAQLTYSTTLAGQGTQTVPVLVNATITSVAQQLIQPVLSVYPNPANNLLTVSTDKVIQNATLTVLNAVGQQVLRQPYTTGHNQVSIASLPDGVYILQLQSRDAVASHRFVKLAR